jgi:hypothetical protein
VVRHTVAQRFCEATASCEDILRISGWEIARERNHAILTEPNGIKGIYCRSLLLTALGMVMRPSKQALLYPLLLDSSKLKKSIRLLMKTLPEA